MLVALVVLLGTVPRVVLLVSHLDASFVELSLELFVLKLAIKVGDPRGGAQIGEQFSGIGTLGFVLAVGFHAGPKKYASH